MADCASIARGYGADQLPQGLIDYSACSPQFGAQPFFSSALFPPFPVLLTGSHHFQSLFLRFDQITSAAQATGYGSDAMQNLLRDGLLKDRERRLKPPYPTSYFGEHIDTLDSGEELWELSGDVRTKYYTSIHSKLLDHLSEIFDTACIADWITLPVYMVGRHRSNAVPTVMVCSKDENARKRAKKEIKKSGLLKEHGGFKLVSLPEDPGMRNMKQLASDGDDSDAVHTGHRATRVLFDICKPLQPQGMEIWVDHGSSLRPTTAFVARIGGRVMLRTVHHAFVPTVSQSKPADSKAPLFFDSDSDDSETDIDSEYEDEDDYNVAITSIGSQSPDAWSISSSDSDQSSISAPSSGRSTPSADTGVSASGSSIDSDLHQVTFRLAPLASSPKVYPRKRLAQPPVENLADLGQLSGWSVDKDWALIQITDATIAAKLGKSIKKDTQQVKPLPGLKENSKVIAHTSSGGALTGTFSGIPFLTRLPNSTSFQEVHRVRLDGGLANGDCGSAVRDADTGELYGHIVAGCETTGTAYIMAAHQVEADFATLAAYPQPESAALALLASHEPEVPFKHPSQIPEPNIKAPVDSGYGFKATSLSFSTADRGPDMPNEWWVTGLHPQHVFELPPLDGVFQVPTASGISSLAYNSSTIGALFACGMTILCPVIWYQFYLDDAGIGTTRTSKTSLIPLTALITANLLACGIFCYSMIRKKDRYRHRCLENTSRYDSEGETLRSFRYTGNQIFAPSFFAICFIGLASNAASVLSTGLYWWYLGLMFSFSLLLIICIFISLEEMVSLRPLVFDSGTSNVITSARNLLPRARVILANTRARKAFFASIACMLAQTLTGINIVGFLYVFAKENICTQPVWFWSYFLWVLVFFNFTTAWMGRLERGLGYLKIFMLCLLILISFGCTFSDSKASRGREFHHDRDENRTLGDHSPGFCIALLLAIFSTLESFRPVIRKYKEDLKFHSLISSRCNSNLQRTPALTFAYPQSNEEDPFKTTQCSVHPYNCENGQLNITPVKGSSRRMEESSLPSGIHPGTGLPTDIYNAISAQLSQSPFVEDVRGRLSRLRSTVVRPHFYFVGGLIICSSLPIR